MLELGTFDGVFADLAEVVGPLDALNLANGEFLSDLLAPLDRELGSVNPPGLDQRVDVDMPAAPLVGGLDRP